MKKPSVSSEVRAYIAERDPGTKLTVKSVAAAIGAEYGKVSAQMSLLYRTGYLAKEKIGAYVTTAESIKASTLKGINAPGPYHKDIKPGNRTTIATNGRVLINDFAGMLSKAKEQMFDLSITIERMERALASLDLSLFPEAIIWAELKRRRQLEGKEIK